MLKNKMYRTITTFVIAMISVLAIFTLSSCKEEKEDRDILTIYERAFFDTFVEKMLPKYYNPASVEFLSVDGSYMQDGIVKFSTSSINEEEKLEIENFFLAIKDIDATSYYEKEEYIEFLDATKFADEFTRGDYYRINSDNGQGYIDASTSINKKGLIFSQLNNPNFLFRLIDNYTFRLEKLNSELEDYKKENSLINDILTAYEKSFLNAFTSKMLPKYYDPFSVKIVSIDASYLDSGIVHFTTSSKNEKGEIIEEKFFLAVSGVTATSFYEDAGYSDCLDETMYAQSFSMGDYCKVYPDHDQIHVDADVSINQKGLLFSQLKNSPEQYDKLSTNYTLFRLDEINSRLETYKEEKKAEIEKAKNILTAYENNFLKTFVDKMLNAKEEVVFEDPFSVQLVNIDSSYLDAGIVRFTTSYTNIEGKDVEEEFFLVVKDIEASQYYEAAGYKDLYDEENPETLEKYAQAFKKGDYFRLTDIDSLDSPESLIISGTDSYKEAMVLQLLKNSPEQYDKLATDYTLFRVDELNSQIEKQLQKIWEDQQQKEEKK